MQVKIDDLSRPAVRGLLGEHLASTHLAFLPAQQWYKSTGFEVSGPFADYNENPHSLFMALVLPSAALG